MSIYEGKKSTLYHQVSINEASVDLINKRNEAEDN